MRTRRSAEERPANGGVVARRAVVRWAWRLFRREWRQQALVLALLTVAVAATIFSASSAYNRTPVPGNAEFGSVNHYIRLEGLDPQAWESDVAFAQDQFGTIDLITHRSVPVPGSVDTVEYRAQDPHGPYGGPMLALQEGRYPTGAGEVAVTDGIAEAFALDVGAPFALDGTERTVVGLVENPSDLSEDFALVDPLRADLPESVTILVDAGFDQVFPFRAPSGASTIRSQRPSDEDVAAAVDVVVTATVAMVLISLVAAASFVVVAQRRLRQLGMLAAIGATESHLRLVTVASGAVVGVLAAVIGAVIGVLGWVSAVPFIEPGLGYRIEPFNIPWWLIEAGMLLAIVTATAAAWWPARTVARIPITLALSGRPPQPKLAHRSAALAGGLIVVGVVCLARADRTTTLLTITGTVAIVVGVLLIGPSAIRGAAWPMARLPVAARLALRDLARYQARAGLALAAISLALGIAVATIVTATAAEHTADEGNLSNRQILIRIGDPNVMPGDFSPFLPERTPADLARLEAEIDRFAASLGEPTVTALDVALDPAVSPEPGFDGRPAVTLTSFVDMGSTPGWRDITLVYVATPELLDHYGLDLDAIDPDTEILTVETAELRYANVHAEPGAEPDIVPDVKRISPTYTSLPGSFIAPEELRRRGWETVRFGWIIEANEPLTSAQLAAARSMAVDAGMTTESRDAQADLADQRSQATLMGMLLALGVLAMTVGLIRGEAAGDLRILTATGATSTTRRTLTAATAGALALLGAALGTAGAYLALIAWYVRDLGTLTPVPVLHLAITAVGLPLAAVIAGWLLAGREPSYLARRPIE